jgi:hypothetical protein
MPSLRLFAYSKYYLYVVSWKALFVLFRLYVAASIFLYALTPPIPTDTRCPFCDLRRSSAPKQSGHFLQDQEGHTTGPGGSYP